MKKTYNTNNFDNMSWHDNYLHGIFWQFESYTHELILDIDYICEWICEKDKEFMFKVSPADLVFHDITDLKINVNSQICIEGGVPILSIKRQLLEDQKVHLDKPYYKWTIELDDTPAKDSYISFGSTGFTQKIRKKPILIDRQSLTLDERKITNERISRTSLIVYAILAVLSLFLMSMPGNYIEWYCVMGIFAIPPIIAGPKLYRILGVIALTFAIALSVADYNAGQKSKRIRLERYQKHLENEKNAQLQETTNTPPPKNNP